MYHRLAKTRTEILGHMGTIRKRIVNYDHDWNPTIFESQVDRVECHKGMS